MITAIASLAASPLAKLALAVFLLSAGAGAGWHAHGKWIAGDIVRMEKQAEIDATSIAQLTTSVSRAMRGVTANRAQAQDCEDRAVRYEVLYARAHKALDKARAGSCDNATSGNHGDLTRILNEASAGRWDE